MKEICKSSERKTIIDLNFHKSILFKFLPLVILLFASTFIYSQNSFQLFISNNSFVATDSILPFWFTANQQGKIKPSGSFLNISDLYIGQEYKSKTDSKIGYTWGTDLIAAFGDNNYFQVNQAFAGFLFDGWEIKGGIFNDETKYSGLSTTNGNLAQSQNARRVPAIRFSTFGFKNFPFAKKWLSFYGEYEEGFLNDERYVDGAHLHHKSLYLKFKPAANWFFNIGFEHFVMWGGTSRNKNIGELPHGFDDYWRYILALPGDDSFQETDQLNSSGNQLGTYQFEIVKSFSKMEATFYLSHPFEDNSGLNWHNWPDNLLGLHLKIKKDNSFITDILYEFTNTRQQSISDSIYWFDENSDKWKMREFDNYYNHGIYRSGFTYMQQTMSSPLFFPLKITDGISMGIRSNRFLAHHVGARGYFTETFRWKGMLTYIQHLGTWSEPYKSSQNQFSGLFEVRFVKRGFPVELGVNTAGDFDKYKGKNLGFNILISKKW